MASSNEIDDYIRHGILSPSLDTYLNVLPLLFTAIPDRNVKCNQFAYFKYAVPIYN